MFDLTDVAEVSFDCWAKASRLGFSLKSGGGIGDVSLENLVEAPTAGV